MRGEIPRLVGCMAVVVMMAGPHYAWTLVISHQAEHHNDGCGCDEWCPCRGGGHGCGCSKRGPTRSAVWRSTCTCGQDAGGEELPPSTRDLTLVLAPSLKPPRETSLLASCEPPPPAWQLVHEHDHPS